MMDRIEKLKPHVDKLKPYVENVINLASLFGFGSFTILAVLAYLSTSPKFLLSHSGIWIQGVPFGWVVGTLALASLRTAYQAIIRLKFWEVALIAVLLVLFYLSFLRA
ncbi:MAG TPA: hypothetical protein VGS11_07615 [Candidatus Bathyarchaeia archaeon]|nr:hypothetical protein [Candidatus Bathyarchaeia archaeon]